MRKSYTQLTGAGIAGGDRKPLGFHNLPQEDPHVYTLFRAADTAGVFQVESRIQMAALPRLRLECFYDIIVEMALIHPDPIQGDAVSPYLARRRGRESVTYPHPLIKPTLEETLGILLFQEQLVQIAIDIAEFTPTQANRLRKAMGAKRPHERMSELKSELYSGMTSEGVPPRVHEEIYGELDTSTEFGFPESHSLPFTYLVYASAWLKVHFPEHFYAGILAVQLMDFYSPQSLMADARRHGVYVASLYVVHPLGEVSVRERDAAERGVTKCGGERTEIECDEPECGDGAAASTRLINPHRDLEVHLGPDSVRGLGAAAVSRVLKARQGAPLTDTVDMARHARLEREQLEALAAAGALQALGAGRREGTQAAQALADRIVQGKGRYQPTLPGTGSIGTVPALDEITEQEAAIVDISSTGVSAGSHPMQFLRGDLAGREILKISDLGEAPVDEQVRITGVVTHYQRPWTAAGVTFISLEDRTGILNVMCSAGLWDRCHQVARHSQGLVVRGMVRRGDGAMNFVADALEPLVLPVQAKSQNFRQPASLERRGFTVDERWRLAVDKKREPAHRIVHMSLIKILFKAAHKAGPAALLAVVRYGPELRKLAKGNPRVVESMTKRFRAVVGAKEGPSDKKDLHRRVEVLHEQVTYVYASINTSDVARQAAKWRGELERIDHAISVVESINRREQLAECKKLVRRLGGISASVLVATAEDAVRDTQIVGEGNEAAGTGDSKDGRTGGTAGDDDSAESGGSARNDDSAGSSGPAEKGGAEANQSSGVSGGADTN